MVVLLRSNKINLFTGRKATSSGMSGLLAAQLMGRGKAGGGLGNSLFPLMAMNGGMDNMAPLLLYNMMMKQGGGAGGRRMNPLLAMTMMGGESIF